MIQLIDAAGSGDLKNAEPADPSFLKTTPTNESTASPQIDPFTGAIFPSDIHAEASSKYHNQVFLVLMVNELLAQFLTTDYAYLCFEAHFFFF